MTNSTIEALNILKEFGVRVARTGVVDSPEDAIAFAERRTAKDPRFMPIVLRKIASGAAGHPAPAAALHTEDAGRRAFVDVAGESGGKALAQLATEPGTDITVAGRTDEVRGKTLTLSSATHSVEAMVPLGSAGAEMLTLNLQAFHHRGSSEKAHRMLEHLLLRVSDFFEEMPVTEFQLAVRLHENSYTVLDASMTSPKALHAKQRLGRHAQDKRGAGYHPSGRQ